MRVLSSSVPRGQVPPTAVLARGWYSRGGLQGMTTVARRGVSATSKPPASPKRSSLPAHPQPAMPPGATRPHPNSCLLGLQVKSRQHRRAAFCLPNQTPCCLGGWHHGGPPSSDLVFRSCHHTGFHQINISTGTKDEDHPTLESDPELWKCSLPK